MGIKIINGLEVKRLSCDYCGADSWLYRVTNLSDNKILCLSCIKNKTDEELGIEPMDKEVER